MRPRFLPIWRSSGKSLMGVRHNPRSLSQDVPAEAALLAVLPIIDEQIPDGANLIVISRLDPDAGMSRLAANEQMAVVGMPQLQLTRAETRAIVGQYFYEPANPVVKAAFAHVQFETIHPFLDGNGRVGRLLITLMLCHDNVLREPLLYPSLYFKQHWQQYYEELNAVRAGGDYEPLDRLFRGRQFVATQRSRSKPADA